MNPLTTSKRNRPSSYPAAQTHRRAILGIPLTHSKLRIQQIGAAFGRCSVLCKLHSQLTTHQPKVVACGCFDHRQTAISASVQLHPQIPKYAPLRQCYYRCPVLSSASLGPRTRRNETSRDLLLQGQPRARFSDAFSLPTLEQHRYAAALDYNLQCHDYTSSYTSS